MIAKEKIAEGIIKGLFDTGRRIELYQIGERGIIKFLKTNHHFSSDKVRWYKHFTNAEREFNLLTRGER